MSTWHLACDVFVAIGLTIAVALFIDITSRWRALLADWRELAAEARADARHAEACSWRLWRAMQKAGIAAPPPPFPDPEPPPTGEEEVLFEDPL